MILVLSVLLFAIVLAFVALAIRGRGALETVEGPIPAGADRALVWHLRWIVLAVAVLLAFAVLRFWVSVPVWIALAIALAFGVALLSLLHLVEKRRTARLESQLAEGIDLIVMTLRAGGSLSAALAGAARETRRPFRNYLNELVERIRLGESPTSVLADLETRIPQESFRLFSYALAAHWEGGGSLASTLANVGRTIRDRVDLSRRISSQAVETQVSVFGVLVVTYGLALLMWNNYPERFESFASSEIGVGFIAVTIFLQGAGVFWISRLSKIEV